MALGNKDRARRAMWIHERTFTREETTIGKEYKEGFYMFGGVNREEEKLCVGNFLIFFLMYSIFNILLLNISIKQKRAPLH